MVNPAFHLQATAVCSCRSAAFLPCLIALLFLAIQLKDHMNVGRTDFQPSLYLRDSSLAFLCSPVASAALCNKTHNNAALRRMLHCGSHLPRFPSASHATALMQRLM